jgi:hypothetical protein
VAPAENDGSYGFNQWLEIALSAVTVTCEMNSNRSEMLFLWAKAKWRR